MASEVIMFFAALAAIIFIGYFSEIIFKKTKIPDVLILMFLGILISWLGYVTKDQFGFTASIFTTFALVFLLFQGALNIDFKTLFQSLKGTVKLTVISFVLTSLTVTLVSWIFLRFDILTSLLVGMILSGTSSAVVIPIVSNLRANKKFSSILTLESAISDVFVIVGAITVMAIIIEGNINGASIVQNVLSSFVLALFVGAAIGFVWILVLTRSKHLMDSYMVTIAVVMALYAFVESPLLKASGAIAVLSFGLMIGNSKIIIKLFKRWNKDDEENKIIKRNVLSLSAKNFYSEISFFVKVFFFVYLGILFDFSDLWTLLLGIVVTISIFAIRIPIIKLAFFREKIDDKSKALMQYLVPKGLAAAVLAQLAIQQGIPGAEKVVNIVFSVILISIIMTSILVFLIGRTPTPGFSFDKSKKKETKTSKESKQESSFEDYERNKESLLPALFFNNPFSSNLK